MTNPNNSVEQDQLLEEPSQQPKSNRKKACLIVAIIFGILFVCSLICVGVVATGLFKVGMEKAPIETVLDIYMQELVSKDFEGAFALFSPRAQRQMQLSDLEELTQGNNYYLFVGYKNLTVQSININAAANSNPDLPQGTVANVEGIIEYDGAITGQFSAVLEKNDGEWEIFSIRIIVPPNKVP